MERGGTFVQRYLLIYSLAWKKEATTAESFSNTPNNGIWVLDLTTDLDDLDLGGE